MDLILSIESGTNICSVALSNGLEPIDMEESHDKEYSHSKNLTLFIENLMKRQRVNAKELKAIAVSKGPGSYTGLRIGISAAKGICYAVDKPLIALSSLQVMAYGALEWLKSNPEVSSPDFLCPMIDARRMEVYTQVFDMNLNEHSTIDAKILDHQSFSELLDRNKILFFGNGSEKFKNFVNHHNACFVEDFNTSARFMISLAWRKYNERQFEDVAYFEPMYLKDFVATIPKNKVLFKKQID